MAMESKLSEIGGNEIMNYTTDVSDGGATTEDKTIELGFVINEFGSY